MRLEELEDREVPTVEGLDIPGGHALPRLWFDSARLAQTRQWYAAHPFTPAADNPLDNAFVYQMTGNPTYGQRAVASLVNFTISDSELNGVASDTYRWNGWVPVVYDWCYDQLTPSQRSAFTERYNTYTTTIIGKSWGGPGFESNNYYWGYWRNELNWGIASYGDNPMAESYIHDALVTRWQNDFVPWAAGSGAGGVAQEGTQYGRSMLSYPLIPLVTARLDGRDLLAESNFYTEAAYNLIYSTSAGPLAAPGGGDYYQVFPFNDDEKSLGFPRANDSDYADFMTVLAEQLSGTNVAGHVRQWLSTVGAQPTSFIAAVDSGGGTRSLSSLPTDYFAPGPGYLYAKSDWTPAAMSLGFQLGWVFDGGVGHGHRDAGSFQISRNGQWLTKESTGYTGDIVGYKGLGTAWVGSDLGRNGVLFQGQGLVEPQYANGAPRITRLESRPDYTFASVDLTPAFRTNSDPYATAYDNAYASSVVRDFVYVRGLGALITFDRMESRGGAVPADAVEKTFLLHFPNSPTVSGNSVIGINGDQALRLTALTPNGQPVPTFRVVNETPSTTTNGVDYQYRLEETTTGQPQSYLINVLQARDATDADLAITMTEDAHGFTITLRDPTSAKTAVVKLDRGMTSTGGSFGYSPVGTPTSLAPLTADVQTIRATADGVVWGPLDSAAAPLQVTAPTTAVAGSSISVTVTAKTATGNTDATYRGTVQFTSTDGQGSLPANYTFTATDAGSHTFNFVLKTAGQRSVIVTDAAAGSVTGSATVAVTPAPAAAFDVSARQGATAGGPKLFSVTARDAYWNRAAGFAGTVRFTSTDALAVLPANYTFTSADQGTHAFSATLNTVGSRTIIATDINSNSTTGALNLTVTSGVYSLWNVTDLPAVASWNDPRPQELGIRFYSDVAGFITGLRFYKGLANTGTHVGHLWASDGTLLAQATFTNETPSGWQQVNFASPVLVSASTYYVASYFAPTGNYAFTPGYFANGGVTGGSLHAPADGANGGSGVFSYAAGGGFPTQSYNGGNYWVDPIISVLGTDSAAPTVISTSPGSGATGVARSAMIAAKFGEPLQSDGISFVLRDPAGTSINGVLSYDAVEREAVFVPSLPLQWGARYTATLSAARDLAGNVMTPVSWSFTTQSTPTVTPFASGSGTGGGGRVTLYNSDQTVAWTALPFGTGYTGGVRVAVGDVTGDGVADVVAATAGNVAAQARIIDGATHTVLSTQLLGTNPYTGPVSVAVGDVTGDRIADIALGTDENGPRAQIIRGGDFREIADIAGPAADFRGGAQVSLGDMNGDGRAELVITGTYSSGSLVRGYVGRSLAPGFVPVEAFSAFTLAGGYIDGLSLAVGDVSGDGRADLILGTPASATPQVSVYSGSDLIQSNTRTVLASFSPANANTSTGVRVAVRDLDGDGVLDLLTSSGEIVSAFKGGNLPATGNPALLFAFDPDPSTAGDVWIG